MKRELGMAAAVSVVLAFPAWSAGYGLKEQSAREMGAAYAGVAADMSNPSALPYNPATLAGVADTDASFSLVEIVPHSSAVYTAATTAAGTPMGGAAIPRGFIADAPIPELSIRHRLTDDLAIGLSISTPYGLKTNYPSDWVGRYYALETEETTVKIAPAIAWQVTDELSLGASLDVEYARGVLTSAVDIGTLAALNGIPGAVPGMSDGKARLSGISWSQGYTLGAIYQPAPDWSLGISYQSAVYHTLSGRLIYDLDPAGLGNAIRSATGLFSNTRGTAKLTMPDMVMFGARKQFGDDFTLMAELDWTNWNHFHDLTIVAQNPAQPNDVTQGNWHGSIFASLGGEYRLDDSWKLRAGAGYDESPAPDATRTPRSPDANRTWLAVGASYNLSPETSVDLSFGHLFNDDMPIALNSGQTGNALRGDLSGTVRSSADVVGLQVSSAL